MVRLSVPTVTLERGKTVFKVRVVGVVVRSIAVVVVE